MATAPVGVYSLIPQMLIKRSIVSGTEETAVNKKNPIPDFMELS